MQGAGQYLLLKPFHAGDKLEVEEILDAADGSGEGGCEGEGHGEGHMAVGVAKAHLVVPRLGHHLQKSDVFRVQVAV